MIAAEFLKQFLRDWLEKMTSPIPSLIEFFLRTFREVAGYILEDSQQKNFEDYYSFQLS